MVFAITPEETRARARADLRMGVPVGVTDGKSCWVAAAVETLGAERLTILRTLGDPVIVLTQWRAQTLAAPAYDGDLVRIAVSDDAKITWLHAMADPSLDMANPIKGPFRYVRDGPSHVPRGLVALCKGAGLLPSVVMAEVESIPKDLLHIQASILNDEGHPSPMDLISSARVPLVVSQNARVHVYRKADGGEEHYAVEIGTPARDKPVLSRLHSACFTGDLIGSLKCDCGAQLQAALGQIGAEGAGVLLYLNQEGRGIGLANKMRAYALQDQGFDTVEANHRLGFEDDERDFRLGAEILRKLGFGSVRLMTNNPAKIARMEDCGITVAERVPLKVGQTPENERYLAVKAQKSGHLL